MPLTTTRHIKVFASIRKEAYQLMRKKESLGGQIKGQTLDLNYSQSQLREIFIKNIYCTKSEKLVSPNILEKEPIKAFLGFDTIIHTTYGGQKEDVFSYIYRHSLKRPRDLMRIGRVLSYIERNDRNQDNIRKVINKEAYEIAEDYITEMQPFSEIENFNCLLKLIHSNSLTRENMVKICSEYNNLDACNELNCKNCEKTHVFCNLYNLGLLGIVRSEIFSGANSSQEFIQPGNIPYESRNLPYSPYYLMHPILNDKIRKLNIENDTKYVVNDKLIIGDGYPWMNPTSSSTNANRNVEEVNYGIVTALPEEFEAVKSKLNDIFEHNIPGQGAGRRYFIGEIPANNGKQHLVALSLAGVGNNMAATRASLFLEHFPNIKSLVMVGIAGGIPNVDKPEDHVRLGDIVVSNKEGVIQYDYIKETEKFIIMRPPPRAPNPTLLEAVDLLIANDISDQRPWLKYVDNSKRPSDDKDILSSSLDSKKITKHPQDNLRTNGQPRIFYGPIASSNGVLKDPIKRDLLRDIYGVKAVEMEGSGIADATWNHESGYLVIRGISDYCDKNKGAEWRNYAADVAAAYAIALIESIPKA